jgi:uncharacterized coiled-coil DUF342 family protein
MDTKELTIAEAATEVLAEIKLKKELAALESKIGTDPATDESIRQLAQQIRDSGAELEAIPQEFRRDKNYKIAEHCHDMLKEEWRAQYRKLAADKMRSEFLQYVIGLRELLIEGQAATDEIADLQDAQIACRLFTFYADVLTPGLTKCLVTPIGEILKGGIV